MKFRVTKVAGEWIAGMRSPGVGQLMELTAQQAEYELMRGVLEPATEQEDVKPLVVPPAYQGGGKGKGKRR